MDLKTYAEWKKSDQKRLSVYSSFIQSYWKWQLIYRVRKQISSCLGTRVGRGKGDMVKFLRMMDMSIFFFNIYLFGCTSLQLHTGSQIFVTASGIFSCSVRTLSCGIWDLVPWPGIKPKPPALGARSLSHWTTREVLDMTIIVVIMGIYKYQNLPNCVL